MAFWKNFLKYAIPIGAGAATLFTGGAAAPLLGMALGGGAGIASSKLGGGSWKNALISGGIGAGLGGIGGGALKGMGGAGKFLGSKAGQAALAGGSKFATGIGQGQAQGMGQPSANYSGGGPMFQGQGYLNPIGLQTQRRTGLAGMGTRQYA
jgi:hypothetical protein